MYSSETISAQLSIAAITGPTLLSKIRGKILGLNPLATKVVKEGN